MKTSDLFVKCLEEEGIEYIFGVPGEENADFVMSLAESDKIWTARTKFPRRPFVSLSIASGRQSLF